jgi:hypothetical protein
VHRSIGGNVEFCGPLNVRETGRHTSRPDSALLTGRLVGRLKLRPLLPDGHYFLSREQALHLDVVKAIG